MSACASCGFANPEGLDFCPQCGAYTRWDPTVHVAAVRGPAPEQEQQEEAKPAVTGVPAKVADSVIVTVRKLEDEAADAPVALTLAPGAQAALVVTVRNQSGIVDNYDLEVRGMPADWWTLAPPTVYLVPYGAPGGSYEDSSTLHCCGNACGLSATSRMTLDCRSTSSSRRSTARAPAASTSTSRS